MKNKNDFRDFLQASSKPSAHTDESIMNFVNEDLNPAHKIVFLKLVAVQAFIGLMTMFFCPQFEFSLTNNHDVFHYFHHHYGKEVCMMVCGSIFLGSGALFASFILSQGEKNTIRGSRFIYFPAMAVIAISAFMICGADMHPNHLTFWSLGAIGSGILIFEINRILGQILRRLRNA
jgi:hypothetical protein